MAHKFKRGDKVIFDINKNWGELHMGHVKKVCGAEMLGVITNYNDDYEGDSGVLFLNCYKCRVDTYSNSYCRFIIPQEYILSKNIY